MDERDIFLDAFYLVITAVLLGQVILNFWAWRIQRRIEKQAPHPVPVALKDREEVTFWQTVSSALLAIIGIRAVLHIPVDTRIILVGFGIALSIKTIPSARWLYRYYRNGFDR